MNVNAAECAQYAITHEIKMVESSLTSLKLALSDQNLELLPDYESRVELLKRLKFIDDNSTVLLKGRVACEVSFVCPPCAFICSSRVALRVASLASADIRV